jgi:hypothetical protein
MAFVGKPQPYSVVVQDIQKAIPKVTFCTHHVIVIADAATGQMEIGISPDHIPQAVQLLQQSIAALQEKQKMNNKKLLI